MKQTYSFICRVSLTANSEAEALRRVQSAASFEHHWGIDMEIIDLKKKFPKEEPKSGTKDSSFKDPMPELRAKVRRVQG